MNKFLTVLLVIALVSSGPIGWIIGALAWKNLKTLWNS